MGKREREKSIAVRNVIKSKKQFSTGVALCVVFLIGFVLLTSGYVANIHFAYAKKHGGSSSSQCTGNETCPTPTPYKTLPE